MFRALLLPTSGGTAAQQSTPLRTVSSLSEWWSGQRHRPEAISICERIRAAETSSLVCLTYPDTIDLMAGASDLWTELYGAAFRGRRFLVTGGAGFIGSHLSEALATLGASVIILDNLDGGDRENIASFAGNGSAAEFVEGSILDRDIVARCAAGCSVVFHLAALGSVPRSVAQPARFHEVNSTGTLNVLEASRAAGVGRVILAASSSAYGDSVVLPKVETMAPVAKSPYAATKLAGEALLSAYASCYIGFDAVSLRYFNIFGPRQNANSAYAAVIAAFAKAMLAGERPIIFGDGAQSRDFTFVLNAVHANLLAARAPHAFGGAVVNVGTGRSVSVTELAAGMASAFGRANLTPVYEPPRAGDVMHSLADLSLAHSVLGYEPIISFEAGLQQTVQWYARQRDIQR